MHYFSLIVFYFIEKPIDNEENESNGAEDAAGDGSRRNSATSKNSASEI